MHLHFLLLSYIFTECKGEKDVTAASRDLWKKVALYLKDTQRTGARQHQALGLCTIEGKDPMPCHAYVKLVSILCQSHDPEHVAPHLVLLFDWNMVFHAENLVNSHGVYDDALLVCVGLSKSNQEGMKHLIPCGISKQFLRNVRFILLLHLKVCGVLNADSH